MDDAVNSFASTTSARCTKSAVRYADETQRDFKVGMIERYTLSREDRIRCLAQ